jgi:capsular polysaccharide export protein
LIMLLQGPVGPFFRELQQQLTNRDLEVIKINFNGGDWMFSSRSSALNFKGTPAEWSAWLDAFIAQRRPAAIVLFGDSRPYHIEALLIASQQHIAVWCLEEGYIRPNFITCERNGNNARSPIKLSPPEPAHRQIEADLTVKNSFGAMAKYAAFHAIAQSVVAARFRGNVCHRQRPIDMECARWALNGFRKLAFYRANRAVLDSILSHRMRDYYVVALQVHDDLNLLRNGNGWTMQRLIDETARSFAHHAPRNHQLLFKVHPLDRGHLSYRKLVAGAARAYGCESRIRVVDDCPIGPMIRHSDGVITVNSTSGLIALQNGKPLLVLGNAVYSSAALKTLPATGPPALHSFWRQAGIACADDVLAFFASMRSQSLIKGGFYSASARAEAILGVADKIHDGLLSANLARMQTVTSERHSRTDGIEHASLAG